jgi:hypothetical protein
VARGVVTVWGSGTPRREFLHSDDMARACVHLLSLDEVRYERLLGSDETTTGRFDPPLVNVGVGHDVSIAELAETVARIVGFDGALEYDRSKPDGTPRKLMDTTKLASLGWRRASDSRTGCASPTRNSWPGATRRVEPPADARCGARRRGRNRRRPVRFVRTAARVGAQTRFAAPSDTRPTVRSYP